ncbi:MAG TPA: PilZ domain-containing protein [Novosphingobium sp.]|nr:PilZ domain-containing protein [Novosphingobium sp.]
MSAPAAIPLPRTGKRCHARLRVRLPAKLITLDGDYRVVLCDLSQSGARIGQPGLPLLQGQAILLWDKYEAFGRFAWCRAGLAGLAFLDPIPPAWVLATRDLDDAHHLPDDSELQRRHAREWVTGRNRV